MPDAFFACRRPPLDTSKPPRKQPGERSRLSRFGFEKPRIFPVPWFILALLVMLALDRWLPLVQWLPPLKSPVSWLLFMPGLLLLLPAVIGFHRARTGMLPFSKSTRLVTGGIYRYTRNPMYLGMTLVLAAAAVKLGSLGALIPVPLFAWIIQRQFIRHEESFLEQIYGDEFRSYCQRVRRWL